MANMYGADVQQLTDLASAMDQAASQLSATRQSVGAKVQQSSWVGPVADRFRSEWASVNNSKVGAAAQLLSDAALTLRQNAAQQTRASSVDGSGAGTAQLMGAKSSPSAEDAAAASSNGDWVSGMVVPDQQTADNIRAWQAWMKGALAHGVTSVGDGFDGASKFFDLPALGLPVSMHDVFSFLPVTGQVMTAIDVGDKLANGQLPWNEGLQAVGGALRDEGFDHHNWEVYLSGAAVSTVGTVIDAASKADFSPSTISSTVQYVANHSSDALSVGLDSVLHAIPTQISDFWTPGGQK